MTKTRSNSENKDSLFTAFRSVAWLSWVFIIILTLSLQGLIGREAAAQSASSNSKAKNPGVSLPLSAACLQVTSEKKLTLPPPAAEYGSFPSISLNEFSHLKLRDDDSSVSGGQLHVNKDNKFELSLWFTRDRRQHQIQKSSFLNLEAGESARRYCYELKAVDNAKLCADKSYGGAVQIIISGEVFPPNGSNFNHVIYACYQDIDASSD